MSDTLVDHFRWVGTGGISMGCIHGVIGSGVRSDVTFWRDFCGDYAFWRWELWEGKRWEIWKLVFL